MGHFLVSRTGDTLWELHVFWALASGCISSLLEPVLEVLRHSSCDPSMGSGKWMYFVLAGTRVDLLAGCCQGDFVGGSWPFSGTYGSSVSAILMGLCIQFLE